MPFWLASPAILGCGGRTRKLPAGAPFGSRGGNSRSRGQWGRPRSESTCLRSLTLAADTPRTRANRKTNGREPEAAHGAANKQSGRTLGRGRRTHPAASTAAPQAGCCLSHTQNKSGSGAVPPSSPWPSRALALGCQPQRSASPHAQRMCAAAPAQPVPPPRAPPPAATPRTPATSSARPPGFGKWRPRRPPLPRQTPTAHPRCRLR
mmetsp:Transcript_87438/g.260850  ORF Transcript_87438/g.260850 Transcript_87438/m.260850 type:complete len:207 (-) Transcript_87438:16-636(-)